VRVGVCENIGSLGAGHPPSVAEKSFVVPSATGQTGRRYSSNWQHSFLADGDNFAPCKDNQR